jgi:hypothetical protein
MDLRKYDILHMLNDTNSLVAVLTVAQTKGRTG